MGVLEEMRLAGVWVLTVSEASQFPESRLSRRGVTHPYGSSEIATVALACVLQRVRLNSRCREVEDETKRISIRRPVSRG